MKQLIFVAGSGGDARIRALQCWEDSRSGVASASCRLSRGRLALGRCGRDEPGACPEPCLRRVRAGRPHDSRRDAGATL